jgi:iron complex outermembrane receptor protein
MATNASALTLEVVVKAQKRAVSLQDVPISVSAMTGEKIEDASIAKYGVLFHAGETR